MKPWEVWTWKFPDAGEHFVQFSYEERKSIDAWFGIGSRNGGRAAYKAEALLSLLTKSNPQQLST